MTTIGLIWQDSPSIQPPMEVPARASVGPILPGLAAPVSLRMANEARTVPAMLWDLSAHCCWLDADVDFDDGCTVTVSFRIARSGSFPVCSAQGTIRRVNRRAGRDVADRIFAIELRELSHTLAELTADLERLRPELRSNFLAAVLASDITLTSDVVE